MRARALLAMVLAFVLPGAGHLYLRRRARAVAFFALVTFMFILGLAIDGSLYVFNESRGELLKRLASIGSMGSGALYLIGYTTGPYGNIQAMTFEYGRTFTLTAGLMNLLLVLDCYDIARGRKS